MAVYHKNLESHEDTVVKHKITDEEVQFLRDLQKELNTQDTLSQASPRYWVIKGTERLYNVEDADGYELVDDDGCDSLADSTEGICDYINENLLDEINNNRLDKEKYTVTYQEGKGIFDGCNKIIVSWFDNTWEEERIEELEDLQDIKSWLEEQGYDYRVVSYKIIPKIYENTMFLTQIDAENHLRSNYYHYSEDAHTYAMTAWRSPRVEKLVKILQEVDFGMENI